MSTDLLIAFALLGIALVHALVIGSWHSAISEQRNRDAEIKDDGPMVSVIVPARDEERGIAQVLQDLHAQSFPKERYEVIVVDDASSDRTASIVRGMCPQWPGLRVLSNAGAGKKAAITTGANAAVHELIVLTDADTRCGPERLKAIAMAMREQQADLLILPVRTVGHGLLGWLQSTEQAALLGMSMGSALNGAPVLAYGANLAFTAAAFREVGGFANDRFASGDDLFLLRRMRAQGKRIGVHFSSDSLVTTEAVTSWIAFFAQRLRWAGKMRGAIGVFSLLGVIGLALPWMLLAESVNFSFVDSMGQRAFHHLLFLATAWMLWAVPPLNLVAEVQRAFGMRVRFMVNVFALLAFSAYAPVIAVLSLVLRTSWKGRRM